MKRTLLLAALLLVCSLLSFAQTAAERVDKNTWEVGVWAGGGAGLGASSEWRFGNAGVRVGRVLTNEIGSGKLRGTFQYAADIVPLWVISQPRYELLLPEGSTLPGRTTPYQLGITGERERVYGIGFTPVIFQWNFTAGEKIVPFFAAEGGLLMTSKDFPLPNSSKLNFTPGGAFGARFFVADNRALVVSGHVTHFSNASTGIHNPGVNAAVLLRVGYTWLRKDSR